jgi:hypothetical protein
VATSIQFRSIPGKKYSKEETRSIHDRLQKTRRFTMAARRSIRYALIDGIARWARREAVHAR